MTGDLRRENAELRATIERLRGDLPEPPGYDDRKTLLDTWYDNGGTVPPGVDLGAVYPALIAVARWGWDWATGNAAPAAPAVVSRVEVCPECGNPWSGGHFPHCTIGHRLNPSYWQIETVEELDALPQLPEVSS